MRVGAMQLDVLFNEQLGGENEREGIGASNVVLLYRQSGVVAEGRGGGGGGRSG